MRNLLSAALLVVALIGIGLEVRALRLGIPGPHRLEISVYFIVAVYALASIVFRSLGFPRR
ncbi:MAG: hypothetical protein JO060_00235 [Candidatus Eremiobacteraeota bacterium]|nr:hypothetical protein [Candidatus Eremiobacteraeota bacterium]MBV9647219.1 hypothetical protein [Candidatus Eremiobacteraeota bacterium]